MNEGLEKTSEKQDNNFYNVTIPDKKMNRMLLPEAIRDKIFLMEEVINFPTSLLSHWI